MRNSNRMVLLIWKMKLFPYFYSVIIKNGYGYEGKEEIYMDC
jgi:hypothetical protein